MNIRIKTIALPVLAVACFALTSFAQDTEKKVKMKDLPTAVQATVKEVSKGATLRGLAMETEDGKTFYEAELMVNGHSKDVTIDPAGKVVAVEEQVAFTALPLAVQAGLRKLAGKGRIILVESITKADVLVAYEAHVKTSGKLNEIKVSPDGKAVTQ